MLTSDSMAPRAKAMSKNADLGQHGSERTLVNPMNFSKYLSLADPKFHTQKLTEMLKSAKNIYLNYKVHVVFHLLHIIIPHHTQTSKTYVFLS